MSCINTSSQEFKHLLLLSKMSEPLLKAKIALWQRANGIDSFPNVEQLKTIKDITATVAGSTYTWTATGGIPSPSSGTSTTVLFPLGFGTVTLTETRPDGCSASVTLEVAACCTKSGAISLNNGGTSSDLIASLGTSTMISKTFTVNGTWTIDQNINFQGCQVYPIVSKLHLKDFLTQQIIDLYC